MDATLTCTKRAVIRDTQPICGKYGLHIECPCTQPPTHVPVYPGMAPIMNGVVCGSCGAWYDHEGYIQREGRAV